MSDLLFPIISMVLLVLAEAGVLQFTGRQKVDWLDVIFNINSGHMMLWLFRCLEVLCYGLVVNHFSLGLFDNVPVILLWLFTILAWDFGFTGYIAGITKCARCGRYMWCIIRGNTTTCH